jgi:arsenite/tail-anchored protein-transporting ATPase
MCTWLGLELQTVSFYKGPMAREVDNGATWTDARRGHVAGVGDVCFFAILRRSRRIPKHSRWPSDVDRRGRHPHPLPPASPPAAHAMAPLEASLRTLVEDANLKWIFCAGKGGVGKTTNSCALAVALAARRPSVLLVSLDPAHNLSDAFNQKFSAEPSRVRGFDNLDAMEVEPPAPEAADGGAVLADGAELPPEIAELASAVPGIDEAMAFGALIRSVTEMDYDVVVFDTAPTGHSVRLVNFPGLLQSGLGMLRRLVAQFGPMLGSMGPALGMPAVDLRELEGKIDEMEAVAGEVSSLFRDSRRATFVCVCIAEFLSVFETERLVQELGKVGINVRNIVVNQVVRAVDVEDSDRAGKLYKARIAMQARYLEQLVELYGEDFHVTPMPLLQGEVRGRDALARYSELLLREKPEYLAGIPGVSEVSEYPGSLVNVVDDKKLRWIFTSGKGGVGKTTTSCALGVALEKAGRRVLIVSTDPAHNLSDAFGQKISGSTVPTKIDGYCALHALEVDPTDATETYLASALVEGGGGGGGGENPLSEVISMETIRKLVTSVPGIDEAVSFAQISKLAKKMEFDVVLVDLAPTGHALRLLGFPAVADKALARFESMRDGIGPMLSMLTASDPGMTEKIRAVETKLAEARVSVEEVSKMLVDQETTTFVCVAIAEFLSVYETERLVQELVTMGINVRNVVCNQLMDPNEKDVSAALKARRAMQQKYVAQVTELYPRDEFHVVCMPLLEGEVRGVDALRAYSAISIDPDRPL